MADGPVTDDDDGIGGALVEEISEPDQPQPPERKSSGVLRVSGIAPVRLALIVGLAFVVALTGLCGWLGYRAYESRQSADFRSLVVQVARQGAVNLTTIDYEHADADVKRILDSATGQFYDEFSTRSAPFIDMVKKAQSKTSGTVTEAGLESIGDNEGQVLVAVSVATSNKGAKEERPRFWRMRLTVTRNGGDTKVSKVDFVP
ncbi:MAG: mammalian cell entry protein [Mycobacterium sp.]